MRVVVDGVSKTYVDRAGQPVCALDGIDLAVDSEEFASSRGGTSSRTRIAAATCGWKDVGRQMTWWQRHGFIKSTIPLKDIVDTSFLEAAVKAIGD